MHNIQVCVANGVMCVCGIVNCSALILFSFIELLEDGAQYNFFFNSLKIKFNTLLFG